MLNYIIHNLKTIIRKLFISFLLLCVKISLESDFMTTIGVIGAMQIEIDKLIERYLCR